MDAEKLRWMNLSARWSSSGRYNPAPSPAKMQARGWQQRGALWTEFTRRAEPCGLNLRADLTQAFEEETMLDIVFDYQTVPARQGGAKGRVPTRYHRH